MDVQTEPLRRWMVEVERTFQVLIERMTPGYEKEHATSLMAALQKQRAEVLVEPALAQEPEPEWVAVESSNIAMVKYDDAACALSVRFANGGVYRYDGVSPEAWRAFMAAPSLGSYLARHIKGTYPYVKLEPEEVPS